VRASLFRAPGVQWGQYRKVAFGFVLAHLYNYLGKVQYCTYLFIPGAGARGARERPGLEARAQSAEDCYQIGATRISSVCALQCTETDSMGGIAAGALVTIK
jgi:hypothetical protein